MDRIFYFFVFCVFNGMVFAYNKKGMNKIKIRGKVRWILAGTAAAAGIGLCIVFWPRSVSEGEKYIKEQEQKPVEELLGTLAQKRNAEIKAMNDAGQLNVFDLLDSYAILGDSRAVNFKNVLEPERVMADIGVKITNIDQYIDTLKSMQPQNIYIMYGLNDIQSNLNGLEGGYGKIVGDELNKIKEACPQAKIFIIGILPVQGNEAMNGQIATYNEILRQECEKNGWVYIDTSDLAEEQYYEQDGEHFTAAFYPLLAARMLEAAQ